MYLKFRYANLQIGKVIVPLLYILGVIYSYQEYGWFTAICSWILCVTIGSTVLSAINSVSYQLKSQMN